MKRPMPCTPGLAVWIVWLLAAGVVIAFWTSLFLWLF